ncbi:phage minor capsid protein [Tissierella sp.]|uniref:phage minor capsid protein n=1 Tax=Tissierella sp. TaxID=41274 RepID=UPI0028A9FAEF|nr:phage minor capsid protein [Tissierella sp.]
MKNKKEQRDQAYDIREIYQQMELDLIRSMKRNLSRHQEEEQKVGFKFEQWQSAKLRDLERFRKENKKIISKYSEQIEETIHTTIVNTYKESQDNVNEFIKEIKNEYVDNVFVKLPGDLEPITPPVESETMQNMVEEVLENVRVWEEAPTPTDEVFFRMNDDKFNSLIETVETDFNKANAAVLRRMDDVYRQTIFKAQVHYNTGAVGLDQAIDMATKIFLEKGVDAITYSDGKKVNIASYAEMALRTANHRAYLMAEGKKRQEMGLHLVVVSAHATACELCVPWQGKTLIDDVYSGGSKEDGDYPFLSEAMEKGLLHPNCRHNLSTYFPGITTLPKVPDEEKALENYKYEQQQKYIERQIRKYKRLAEGSIDENNKKKYQDKVKEYQKVMREHLKENPQLRRAYNREQTKGVPYDFSKYDELSGLITKDNISIKGISQHLKERVIEREISAKSIEDALKNPLNIGKIKYDKQNRPSVEYIGNNARVQVNPETGNVITVWRTSSKLRNKYIGDKNGKD